MFYVSGEAPEEWPGEVIGIMFDLSFVGSLTYLKKKKYQMNIA